MTNQPFAFKCAYMGATDFACHVQGWPKRVTLYREPDSYELSITRPQDVAKRKSLAGTLSATSSIGPQVTPEIVAAFNDWQARYFAQALASMLAQPERYGPADELDAEPPKPARGAFYDHDASRWVFLGEHVTA